MRLRYVVWFVFLSLLFLPQTLYGQTVPISISNPQWFFSPYNWDVPGTVYADALGRGPTRAPVITTEIVTNEPGAYFTLTFANSTQAVLDLDTLGMPAVGGTTSMVVQWQVDTTLFPPHSLALTDTQLTLATGLSTGPHTVKFWFVSSDYHQDRWSSTTTLLSGYLVPAQSLRITGLTLDPGASLSTPTGIRPKRILFFGDSITEGDVSEPTDDATHTYATLCAQLLNAEYGVVANPGQGWTCNIAPTSGVPAFADAYSLFYAQPPRFPLPLGTPAPDYVIVNMGTNDAIFEAVPGSVTSTAVTWLQQIRKDLPSSRIFLVVPFGGFEAAALQSAYSQYLLTNPTDTKVTLINLGPTAQTGLTGQVPNGTAQSYDGIHPNAATQLALGYQLTAAIQTALGRNDFNGDGKSDLILQNTATNQIADWFQNDSVVLNGGFVSAVPSSGYQIVGSADFNGDGKPDYVFQNSLTGQIALWYMNGTTVIGGGLVSQTPANGYKVVGIGDFNGDGQPDIVFQNQTTNEIVIWFMNGSTVIGGSAVSLVPSPGWKVVGVGDFNRDGQTDLLFQNSTTGALVLWYMNGVQCIGGATLNIVPTPGYHVEAVADYDDDGRPDVVLRDAAGDIQIWHLDGGNVYLIQPLSLLLNPSFRIAGPR